MGRQATQTPTRDSSLRSQLRHPLRLYPGSVPDQNEIKTYKVSLLMYYGHCTKVVKPDTLLKKAADPWVKLFEQLKWLKSRLPTFRA